MSVPAVQPDWKLGDPGSAKLSSSQPKITTVFSSSGAVDSVSYGASSQYDSKSQRSAGIKGVRKTILPGKYWRCATNYFRIVVRVDWQPGIWSTPLSGGRKREIEEGGSDSADFDIDGYPPKFGNGSASFDANLLNRAKTECLVKLNSGKTHLMTELVEARKSAETMAERYNRTARFLLNIKRRNVRWGDTDEFMKTYLEWEYGWKPIANALMHSVETAKKAFKPPLIMEAYRSVKETRPGNTRSGNYHTLSSSQSLERAICHLYAKLSDKYAFAMQGLGLNPLTAAWELYPWSFVVDWAIPVGNVLEALTATAGLDFWDGYTSQTMEASASGQRVRSGYAGDPPSYDVQCFEFRRSKLGAFPRPCPYVKSPFTTSHVVNSIALTGALTSARRGN